MNILEINGSMGEGGGQIFRTSLTLSMCLGRPVRIVNIRAGRAKPGLLRQHLACLRAAKAICDAEVEGDQLGSMSVTFIPGKVKPGEYRFTVGSAGSTTLIFQTVMLPLLFADGVSELYLEGGTHNGMAPSFDFIEHSFIPITTAMGAKVEMALTRFGFYPNGGGEWRARIHPSRGLSRVELQETGVWVGQSAVVTSSKIPEHIAQRELDYIGRKCGWSGASLINRQVESCGPGNIVSLRVQAQHVTQLIEQVGERHVSAERVAGKAVRELKRYLNARVSVGEHLADQLILPMVLGGGGCFSTLDPSLHLTTNMEVVRQFMPAKIRLVQLAGDRWQVTVA